MKVVLFGATGYLGSHLAEQLHANKIDLICLVRQGSNTNFLKQVSANVVEINFSKLVDYRELIDKNTMVINCIADTRSHASYAQRKVVEIDLTQRLFQFAQAQKAQRFIQLSTVMAYGFERPATAIDEDYPLSPKHLYNQVAADREAILLDLHKPDSTELIIVRPSNAFGDRDKSLLPNFLDSHRKGMFPVVDGGKWKFSLIDARDVGRAFAHLTEIKLEKPEVFLVKGFDTDWLSFKDALDKVINKPSKVFNMPKWLMSKLAGLLEFLFPYGSKPPITRFDLDVLSTDTLFDDSKIRATGFKPKFSLEQGLDHAIGLDRKN